MQSSFPLTILRAGHTFVMGVILGLSGVVVKPVAGRVDLYCFARIHFDRYKEILIDYVHIAI